MVEPQDNPGCFKLLGAIIITLLGTIGTGFFALALFFSGIVHDNDPLPVWAIIGALICFICTLYIVVKNSD